MKYSEVIPRLDDELRNAEAWPDTSSKVDEQINLLYIAALSIYRELPLLRTVIDLTESAALSQTALGSNSQLSRAPLPDDLFDLREDFGILTFRLDSIDYGVEQAVSRDAILTIGDNKTHSGNIMFHPDLAGRTIYTTGVDDVKIYYIPKFTRPTNDDDGTTDFEALDWPLYDDNATQRAVHLVAAHVSGSTIRDSANAQFQALLQEVYS